MKPLWEEMHEDWISWIKQDLEHGEYFRNMMIKHEYSDMGIIFKELFNNVEKHRIKICSEYKKKYGSSINIRQLKKEINGTHLNNN